MAYSLQGKQFIHLFSLCIPRFGTDFPQAIALNVSVYSVSLVRRAVPAAAMPCLAGYRRIPGRSAGSHGQPRETQ